MQEPDFSSILDAFSTPVLIAKPVFDGSKIKDFELVFVNDVFKNTVSSKISKSTKFSDFKDLISRDVPWFDLGEKAANKIVVEPTEYFSELSNCWFKIQMRGTRDNLIVINIENISEKKEQDHKLKETAFHDFLTGLPNRNQFNEDFPGFIEKAEFNGNKLGILLLDLDNMKNINDVKGNIAGDEILIQASNLLKQFSKKVVSAYRYGDDEFLVLVKNVDSFNTISNITDTIFETFLMQEINISGGISIYPDNSCDDDELLRFADIAMHTAKKEGKNQFQFFKADMQRVFIQKLNLLNRMTEAVLTSNFSLSFQPQFDVKTCKLRGFEALIRWNDEELGKIPPAVFIPLAEESGLILPIGTWVLNTAFATLKRWQDKYNFNGVISVNLSPLQLKQSSILDEISSLLKTYDVKPEFIEIEITEGIMIDNMDDAIYKMKTLKNMGFRISLDDFGTGYSSLSYLQILPLDTLKIDKSFVNDITSEDGKQATITNSIITMVKNMGLDTIAEGVEQDEQFALLKKFNCNIIQGFLMGKPMSNQRCEAYLSGDTSALLNMTSKDCD